MTGLVNPPSLRLVNLTPGEDGWMSDLEVAILTGYATILPISMGPVLEVGCWKGRATSGLARTGPVEVVDTFLGSSDMPKEMRDKSVRSEFEANLRRLDLLDRVTVHEGNSKDILPALHRARYRLVLVDASHEEEDVFDDLTNAWPLLSPGGWLFADDANWKSVRAAILRFAKVKMLPEWVPATPKLFGVRKP